MPKTDQLTDLSTYSTVAERISLFYQAYPTGRVVTRLVSRNDGETIFKAMVFRNGDDSRPAATGWAAERENDGDINIVACVENTETSAVGRALANLGFTASAKRPSREEMEKVRRHQSKGTERSNVNRTLQLQADTTMDLLDLIVQAELRGFSKQRAAIIRTAALSSSSLKANRISRVEKRIRFWLKHRSM
jgi:hypothetical protein